jgi:hypothetical protein
MDSGVAANDTGLLYLIHCSELVSPEFRNFGRKAYERKCGVNVLIKTEMELAVCQEYFILSHPPTLHEQTPCAKHKESIQACIPTKRPHYSSF